MAQIIAKEIFANYVVEKLRRFNPHLGLAADESQYVKAGAVVHIPQAGAPPILSNMTEQISGVKVVIDKNQDIINNSTLAVSCSVQPLGYATWINVTLGLATALDN